MSFVKVAWVNCGLKKIIMIIPCACQKRSKTKSVEVLSRISGVSLTKRIFCGDRIRLVPTSGYREASEWHCAVLCHSDIERVYCEYCKRCRLRHDQIGSQTVFVRWHTWDFHRNSRVLLGLVLIKHRQFVARVSQGKLV